MIDAIINYVYTYNKEVLLGGKKKDHRFGIRRPRFEFGSATFKL